PGKNWVQLEFIDEQGQEVNNAFNDTVRVINYEPKGEDTLSKLVRGELSVEVARSVVDSTYVYAVEPEPVEERVEEMTEPSEQSPQLTEPVEEMTEPSEQPSELTESVEEITETDESIPEPIDNDASLETVTEETENREPSSEETVMEETEASPEPFVTLEEPETIVEPDEAVIGDTVSTQDSSEIVAEEALTSFKTVTSPSEEIPEAQEQEPQPLDKLVNVFKKIDLSGLSNFVDQIKAKLGQLSSL
ncbi:MAG: hypothetical protein AB4063_11105, partial [Crocosphaera sp.]